MRFAKSPGPQYSHELRSEPSPRLTKPAASSQKLQDVAPGLEKVPSGHVLHAFVSAFRNVPPEQRVQETLPGSVLNSLDGQAAQEVEPALDEKELVAHFSHSEVEMAYVPAEHRVHVE